MEIVRELIDIEEVIMIEIRAHGAVAELQLNRPPVNALNPQLIQAISLGVADVVAGGARAVVLSGGEKVFSAGLDVPVLLRLPRTEITAFWNEFFALMRQLAECPVPLSAAVTGHSPAGGAVLTLFCDHRVMSRDVAALPPAALVTTRRTARADLLALFDDVNDKTCQAMSDVWFSKETQKALHALVERLAST